MRSMSRRTIVESSGLSRRILLTLNGFPQRIVVDGMNANNPIVLLLHGGPGTPFPFNEGCRGLRPEWSRSLTMVYWDQLGCGINNTTIDESFSIDTFTRMAIELIEQLRSRFPGRKVLVAALSWGSILSARIAARRPDLIDGVVAYGQVVRDVESSDALFSALLSGRAPHTVKRRVEGMRDVHSRTVADMRVMSYYAARYTTAYYHPRGSGFDFVSTVLGMLSSPDYRMRDVLAIMRNGYDSNSSLLKEMMTIDLSEDLRHVGVPYAVLQGEGDLVTDTGLMRDLARACHNPLLGCTVLDDESHMPDVRAMTAIRRELISSSRRPLTAAGHAGHQGVGNAGTPMRPAPCATDLRGACGHGASRALPVGSADVRGRAAVPGRDESSGRQAAR
ncbi:MAG: alpha/beta hydrolase [Bifidobacterium sp.]|jgi:pimeloyl-ACP methyl ester carboxylesterase|nr:alpha/beta hydrolase [Bifidobacterium sp.]MCI1865362.1 alpha/beta hydrolase [Bifidobacterium sp.]